MFYPDKIDIKPTLAFIAVALAVGILCIALLTRSIVKNCHDDCAPESFMVVHNECVCGGHRPTK